MTIHRFFSPELASPASLQTLEGPESHHAIKVLRVRVGDSVELFDGNGHVANGTIESLGKRELQIRIRDFEFSPLDSDGLLHFAVALPKGDRQRSVLEKLVEMGVDSILPIMSRYSVAEVDEGNRERLVRYAMEACKQCGRNRNLTVHLSQGMHAFYETIREKCSQGVEVHLLHPDIRIASEALALPSTSNSSVSNSTSGDNSPASVILPKGKAHLYVVGPEGGFTNEEVDQCLVAGAERLDLGPRILRVETAVTVAATLGKLAIAGELK